MGFPQSVCGDRSLAKNQEWQGWEGWRGGLVNKVTTLQVRGLEFGSSEPTEKARCGGNWHPRTIHIKSFYIKLKK